MPKFMIVERARADVVSHFEVEAPEIGDAHAAFREQRESLKPMKVDVEVDLDDVDSRDAYYPDDYARYYP